MTYRSGIKKRLVLTLLLAGLGLASAAQDRKKLWNFDAEKTGSIGKKYLDVSDSTFTGPGKIGLWTKADAQTHFDDLVLIGN